MSSQLGPVYADDGMPSALIDLRRMIKRPTSCAHAKCESESLHQREERLNHRIRSCDDAGA
jgi:hypothetical protein